MWRRHVHSPFPSHHAVRATCTQLLPLVEMYCKWVLQEDCSSLRGLMLQFDSEEELESHELGRSLLDMVRDDDVGFVSVPQPVPLIATANLFDAFRDRLAAAGTAIRGLREQVILPPGFLCLCALVSRFSMPLQLPNTNISY